MELNIKDIDVLLESLKWSVYHIRNSPNHNYLTRDVQESNIAELDTVKDKLKQMKQERL